MPAFLIATVDKFASLPWVGETAGFFGRADRFDTGGFYGPAEPGRGYPLGHDLMPPDPVIQDELHLISGPLGSIAGIYETAIDKLCARKRPSGHNEYAWVRPKLVASTATVRRAAAQVKALLGRNHSCVFPPPGVDRTDSFFARASPADESDPRLYVGLAAQGRSPKVIFLRAMLSSMAAAYLHWTANGGRTKDAATGRNKLNPADRYMTSVCYFNALKELGAARRIVEGELAAPLSNYGTRRKRISEAAPILGDRLVKQLPERHRQLNESGMNARVSTGAPSG